MALGEHLGTISWGMSSCCVAGAAPEITRVFRAKFTHWGMSWCPSRQYGPLNISHSFSVCFVSPDFVWYLSQTFSGTSAIYHWNTSSLCISMPKKNFHTGVQNYQAHEWDLGISESFCIYQVLTKTSALLISCFLLSISLQKLKVDLTILSSLSITQTLYFEFCDADCHSSIWSHCILN